MSTELSPFEKETLLDLAGSALDAISRQLRASVGVSDQGALEVVYMNIAASYLLGRNGEIKKNEEIRKRIDV